jgi:hypothetical protein
MHSGTTVDEIHCNNIMSSYPSRESDIIYFHRYPAVYFLAGGTEREIGHIIGFVNAGPAAMQQAAGIAIFTAIRVR